MNRFLKKKSPEALNTNSEALSALASKPAPSPPLQPAPPLSPGLQKSKSRWRRNKKQPDQAPALDISVALPSDDNFRTSLLMPNLSARFSMLREQDDPTSLIGKASDDSVLQPRRRSRMTDFGFSPGNLGDIAEVSSIHGSVRPPFADSRQLSYASEEGYGSENDSTHGGSMMSRARPGEGNIMFGGRQKIYMIPKSGANSSRSLGKAVYEDDMAMSAFQKYRREKLAEDEGRTSDESQGFDFALDSSRTGFMDDRHELTANDFGKERSNSPALSSYDKKRSTTSTSRSSFTAATSVASQPATAAPSPAAGASKTPATAQAAASLKRADTKTRRLYEQGLDQHMHEQQTSALTRLNSIQRQRTLNPGKPSPPILHSAKSASNLHDKAPQPVYALRGQSPPPSAPLPQISALGSIRNPNSTSTSPVATSGPHSPVSPPFMDTDEALVLNQALEPADRGKATAMGAFNKPKHAFDEHQYLERQRQLQRGNSNATMKKDTAASPALQQRLGRFEHERERSNSNSSARSRPEKQEQGKAHSTSQRPVNHTNAGTFQSTVQQADKPSYPDTHRTFFGNISASDSEDEDDDQSRYDNQFIPPDYGYGTHHGRWQPTVLPSVSEHPALRARKSKASLAEEDEDLEPKPLRTVPPPHSLGSEAGRAVAVQEHDPPVLTGAEPLSGFVQHLRQQSNQSSIYPSERLSEDSSVPDVPEWNPKNLDLINRPIRQAKDSESRVGSTYTNSNPWDLDDLDNGLFGGDRISHASVSPIEPQRSRGPAVSHPPSRLSENRDSDVSQLSAGGNEDSWQNELQKQHNREGSTATQQERDAFANELAARRNAIQENMKSIVGQTPNESPVHGASAAFKAFGMLRPKSSRDSVNQYRQEASEQSRQVAPKAMKMLGMTSGNVSGSSLTLNSQYERSGASVDQSRPRDDSASRPPLPNGSTRTAQSEVETQRDREQSRTRGESESRRDTHRGPAAPSQVTFSGNRSRENSEAATGRSRSRTGPYRDDLEKAMMEGTGISTAALPEPSPLTSRELTPCASPDIVHGAHFEADRARSNSRNGFTNYFDQKPLQPIHTGSKERLVPNGVAPFMLSPNVYSPSSTSSARPSPITSPYTSNMTPPLSGASTPVGSTCTTPAASTQPSYRSGPMLRKKTISKGDISEPFLISSTSNIDTVDLPEGASLKNGMEEPPPLPPINPRRRNKRIFGLGKNESSDEILASSSRSNTPPDPWASRSPDNDFPLDPPRSTRERSDSNSPRNSPRNHPAMRPANFDGPAADQYVFPPASTTGSPERRERLPAASNRTVQAMEGGMF